MSSPFYRACLAAALTATLALPLSAAETLRLMFGAPEAEHATLTFLPDATSPEAIVIETRLVGAAGSRLALSVDRAKAPLFARLLTSDDCRFVEQASTCRLAIAGARPSTPPLSRPSRRA